MHIPRRHLNYANVVATLALAMSGGALEIRRLAGRLGGPERRAGAASRTGARGG